MLQPMTPVTAGTVSRTVNSGSQSVALKVLAAPQSVQVIVSSPSTNAIAFIEFGDSTVTASASTGTPILPGSIQTFTVGDATYVAAIGSAGTLYFTSGYGA